MEVHDSMTPSIGVSRFRATIERLTVNTVVARHVPGACEKRTRSKGPIQDGQ